MLLAAEAGTTRLGMLAIGALSTAGRPGWAIGELLVRRPEAMGAAERAAGASSPAARAGIPGAES